MQIRITGADADNTYGYRCGTPVRMRMFVHLHLLLAGYLFTVSIIANEPAAHRKGFVYRTVMLWLAVTGHGILAKRLYAFPPSGVPAAQAEAGGMLMYYGGDAVELVIFAIFCRQWFRTSRPRVSPASE